MSFAVTATDVSTLATTAGFVTPLVAGFLLVIKWIVNFQSEITDKYRVELHEVRREFDAYKAATEKKIIELEKRIDGLSSYLEDEQLQNAKILRFISEQGLDLPDHLERRRVTNEI